MTGKEKWSNQILMKDYEDKYLHYTTIRTKVLLKTNKFNNLLHEKLDVLRVWVTVLVVNLSKNQKHKERERERGREVGLLGLLY